MIQQISKSYELAEEVTAQANEAFAELAQITAECIATGVFQNYPVEYPGALVESLAVMTVEFASLNRERLAEYQQMGFDILWNGITR